MYKTDNNQNSIVKTLKQLGFSVINTAMVKNGFPDIVVGIHGLNFLCEIKNPTLSPSRRKLTFQEEQFHDNWNGQVCILETIEDCHNLYNLALSKNKNK